MKESTRDANKNTAIEAVLAKISPDDPTRKAAIRDLCWRMDQEHEKLGIYELLRVLAQFPS